MFYNYSYLMPEERKSWRSAYEIEIAARKHESLRLLSENDSRVLPWGYSGGSRKSGFSALLKMPFQMLAALMG